jgi:hypothetical protein
MSDARVASAAATSASKAIALLNPLAGALARETQQQTNPIALLCDSNSEFDRGGRKLFFVPGSKIDLQHTHTIRKA